MTTHNYSVRHYKVAMAFWATIGVVGIVIILMHSVFMVIVGATMWVLGMLGFLSVIWLFKQRRKMGRNNSDNWGEDMR